jgi:hypothetical protein
MSIASRPVVRRLRQVALPVVLLSALAACDLGPNGLGTAPPGVSQEQFEAEIRARNQARSDFYRGPRGGETGR